MRAEPDNGVNYLHPRSRRSHDIPVNSSRRRFPAGGIIALRVMKAARSGNQTHPTAY
jgi:hypothetical protein